jgi:hypothetical protein
MALLTEIMLERNEKMNKIFDIKIDNTSFKHLFDIYKREASLREPQSEEQSKEIDWQDPQSIKAYLDRFVY